MRKRFRYTLYILLGLFTFILTKFFSAHPEYCEQYYQHYVYANIRRISDFLLGWSPVPWIYLLISWVIYLIYRRIKLARNTVFSLPRILFRCLSISALVYFLFQMLWGFNYQQRDLKHRLGLNRSNVEESFYISRLESLICALEESRTDLDFNMHAAIDSIPDRRSLQLSIRKSMQRFLMESNLFYTGDVRVRQLDPPGSLLIFSTAGIYIPFVFEGHIDAGLHPLQVPYTLAHEMAHGYAVMDEGEANFVAFVVCAQSENPFIKYSGLFSYFRYLASNIYRNYPELYHEMRTEFPEFVVLDLNAVRTKMNKYPDLFPIIRNWMYDHYLHAQGVHGGIKSYSSVVQLVTQWELTREYLF